MATNHQAVTMMQIGEIAKRFTQCLKCIGHFPLTEGLRANGCTHVETRLIQNAVHYVVEDQPDEVAGLIERYASLHSQ